MIVLTDVSLAVICHLLTELNTLPIVERTTLTIQANGQGYYCLLQRRL